MKFVRVFQTPALNYEFTETAINLDHILNIQEDEKLNKLFNDRPSLFPDGLDKNQKFTVIELSGNKSVIVVGALSLILSKIGNKIDDKTLLLG